MDDDLLRRLARAEAILPEAGGLALGYFRDRAELAIETKANPQDTVSRADRETEALLRKALSDAFPDDGFLGEESGTAEGTSGWIWVIDPIDGTQMFLHGFTEWCISVGLMRAGEIVGGLILCPCRNELYRAGLGQGAVLNGRPISVSDEGLASGILGIGANLDVAPERVGALIEAVLAEGGMFVRFGSAAMALAHVAAGRSVGYHEFALHLWDCAAGIALVREAGGSVLSAHPMPGRLTEGGPITACRAALMPEMQALLRKSGGNP